MERQSKMADPLLARPYSTGSPPYVGQTRRPLTRSPTLGAGEVGWFTSAGGDSLQYGLFRSEGG